MIEFETVRSFWEANWSWAGGLAASMLGLTLLANSLLNPARKDDIALWLMGAQSDETWARTFTSLFDAVFGERHFSINCFIRSAIASLLAVALIWLMMGSMGTFGLRLQSDLSLGTVLILALAVNVVADYVSLLETRLLLGRIDRFRGFFAQVAILLLDLALSAAIIWLAIFAYLHSPLHQGEIESFAEILGVFSIFSVLFYSTFLTSVWTWAYILSTWLVRIFSRLRLAYWLDVENKPIRILGLVLAGVVFLGALAIAAPLRKDEDGLTAADRVLCSVFRGRVCLDVAKLSAGQRSQFEFINLACGAMYTATGLSFRENCFEREAYNMSLTMSEAVRYLEVACNSGDGESCSGLGGLLQRGIVASRDPTAAAGFYRRGCDLGSAMGCTNLGYLHAHGIGADQDETLAERLYEKGCDGGDAMGCNNLGFLEPDPKLAARHFRKACDAGNALGCVNLGSLYDLGGGLDLDPAAAALLFRQGCSAGEALGCTNLGILYEFGRGMEFDRGEAVRLYRLGCEMGDQDACGRVGGLD